MNDNGKDAMPGNPEHSSQLTSAKMYQKELSDYNFCFNLRMEEFLKDSRVNAVLEKVAKIQLLEVKRRVLEGCINYIIGLSSPESTPHRLGRLNSLKVETLLGVLNHRGYAFGYAQSLNAQQSTEVAPPVSSAATSTINLNMSPLDYPQPTPRPEEDQEKKT